MYECRVQCAECNGIRAGWVACSVFDIWEGQEWVSDHFKPFLRPVFREGFYCIAFVVVSYLIE